MEEDVGMKQSDLAQKNPQLQIFSLDDPEFRAFGRVEENLDLEEILAVLKGLELPPQGNVYVPTWEVLEATQTGRRLMETFYGGLPMQLGYCCGYGQAMNSLEYHKCSELFIAATPLLLFLAQVKDIKHNRLDSRRVQAFFVPENTLLELYSTTLHFAPCRVNQEPFRAAIGLLKETNQPLNGESCLGQRGEDQLLFAKNKWLISHKDGPAAQKGAYVGIEGVNWQVEGV